MTGVDFSQQADRIDKLVARVGWILRKYDLHELEFEDIDGGRFTLNRDAWNAVRKMLINS